MAIITFLSERFQCLDGSKEIPMYQKCDLIFQCDDHSDENFPANCTGETHY